MTNGRKQSSPKLIIKIHKLLCFYHIFKYPKIYPLYLQETNHSYIKRFHPIPKKYTPFTYKKQTICFKFLNWLELIDLVVDCIVFMIGGFDSIYPAISIETTKCNSTT